MVQQLRTVASFATRLEADLLKWRLEQAGIQTCLADEAIVGWFWHYANAVGGIKVVVAGSDLPRAIELLEEFEKEGAQARDAEDTEADIWTCPKCRTEVDGNLTVCWACGTAEDGEETPDFEPATAPVVEMDVDPPAPLWSGFVFAIVPLMFPFVMLSKIVFAFPWPASQAKAEPPQPEQPSIDELAPILRRACLASVLSIISLPVLLNAYSTWLIFRHDLLRVEVRQRAGWYVYSAIVINTAMFLAAAVVGFALVSRQF